jgi:site-specific DNA recombinase
VRYVGYIRISSEDQVGNFSLDAQKRAIEKWVADQGGRLIKIYVDEGRSGTNDDRPGFLDMRRDARRGKFDALVVHKFDRLARNRANALAIKSLLRRDYGIKVFSVTEPSEDSDGAIGALIEGIMEAVADWYSRNLASEVAKGKRERAEQGWHNNQAPFGYDKNEDKQLIVNAQEAKGVRLAFETYAQGKVSDTDVARLVNAEGYHTKRGALFSNETMRDLLQNRTYLGYVRYQPYKRNSNGSRNVNAEIQWFKGQHEAIIDEELFNRCQAVRARAAVHHLATPQVRVYPLSGLIYCSECQHKLRAQALHGYRYYRCRARERGEDCSQSGIAANEAESQIVEFVRTMKPPADWKEKAVQAIGDLLGDEKVKARVAEIEAVIERMDFRWDQGFITNKDEYLQKRLGLQQELEELKPIPVDDLEAAADLLTNFEQHWAKAENDPEEQQRLLHLIFERIWVKENAVVAVSLRPNYHVTFYQSGSDGIRTRDLGLDRAAC